MRVTNLQFSRCPALTFAGLTFPILLSVRVSIIAIVFAGLIAALSDYLRIKFHDKSVSSTSSQASMFALGLSTLAFLRVASLDYGFVRTAVSVSIVVVLIGALATRRDWRKTKPLDGVTHFYQFPSFLIGSLLVSVTLVTLGWQSMIPYVACLSLAILIRHWKKNFLKQLTQSTLVIVGGFGSWWVTGLNSGQFIRSFDQLFRSAYGNGLVTWGRRDNVAATGFSVPGVHWLSEATAGMIAKIPSVSVIDSTFRIMPILSVLLGFFALVGLGEIMGFASRRTWFAAASSIALSSGFKITATGRSWGLVLFLVALNPLMRLWFQTHRSHHAYVIDSRLTAYVVFCTPLVALAQMPVGVIFVAVSLAVGFASLIRIRSVIRPILAMCSLQVVLLLVVRYALVSSENTIGYTDVRLTLRKVLAFDNLGLYVGSNRLFVTGQAVLSFGILMLSAAGLLAANRQKTPHLRALHLAGFVLAPTCIVINVISSSWDRFFHPAVVLLTFASLLILIDQLHNLRKTSYSSWNLWTVRLLSGAAVGLLLTPMILANRLPFGPRKTAVVGLLICIALTALFGLWLLKARLSVRLVSERFLLVSLCCLTLLAHFSHIDGIIRTLQRKQISDEGFLGSPLVRDCLSFITEATDGTSIIGSNWFRIDQVDSLGRRQTVSATTERRTFVDGPENVALPMPEWLLQRVRASDQFADDPTKSNYQLLKDSQVEYFLVVNNVKTATDWKNFATTIFINSECRVLRLL